MKASGLRLFCPLPVAEFRFGFYLRWLECATSKSVADSWERTNALSANCLQTSVLPIPHGLHAGSPNCRICAHGVSSLEPSMSLSSGLLEGSEQMWVPALDSTDYPGFLFSRCRRGACASTCTWVTALAGLHHQRWIRGAEGNINRAAQPVTLYSATHALLHHPPSECKKAVVGKAPTTELRAVDGCAEWRWGRYARPPTS